MDITLCHREDRPRPPELEKAWSAVVTHSHMLRGGAVPFEEAKRNLVNRCRLQNIAALGVGSPWEPVSARHFKEYETAQRDLYYSGRIPPESVMDREEIRRLFDDLNRASKGDTLFYQDNETPKARFGHLWYLGYHYDVPAWHDYGQDRPIQAYEGDPACELNALTGEPHRRRAYLEVVASQRRAGALAVWAHPTSWWLQGGRFITNVAAELALHLHADGFLDGMTIQGYDACHRSYQALWFHLLDTGARIPGFAESDAALDGAEPDKGLLFQTSLPIPRPVRLERLVATAREGRMFATTGAFLCLELDGVPMGRICNTKPGAAHRLRVEAYPPPGERAFSRLDIVGPRGRVLLSVPRFTGGLLEFSVSGSDQAGYVVARAFGEHDDPGAPSQKSIRHMALTNPVYLHPAGFRFLPVKSACHLDFAEACPWVGGVLQFQTATGELLEEHRIRTGRLSATLPASARVTLKGAGGAARQFFPAMENKEVQALLRYLHDGEFRADYPGLKPGEVPPQAFRLDDMRHALESNTLSL